MKENQQIKDLELLDLQELAKNMPNLDITEFSIELELALHTFFHGETSRKGNEITIAFPNGQKFRVVTELLA